MINIHDVERRAVSPSKISIFLNCYNCIDFNSPQVVVSVNYYVMAFTSGTGNAGSDIVHKIEVVLYGEHVRNIISNLPGDDMLEHKGDLWKINLSDFRSETDLCILLSDIQRVYITENNNDGWHIDSIVTLVTDSGNGVQVLTQDLARCFCLPLDRW